MTIKMELTVSNDNVYTQDAKMTDPMEQNRSASSSPSLCTPTPQEVIQMTGWQGEGMEGIPWG